MVERSSDRLVDRRAAHRFRAPRGWSDQDNPELERRSNHPEEVPANKNGGLLPLLVAHRKAARLRRPRQASEDRRLYLLARGPLCW